jgi:HD superfamily phosphohydrolase
LLLKELFDRRSSKKGTRCRVAIISGPGYGSRVTAPERSRRRKSIYDPIHGSISVDGAALELIQHPAFQRLWGIRQTGFAHLVFPGANHTRLEHSLGVYWVLNEMAARLELEAADALVVAAGGLLHDLGHGPFSHTLDPVLLEVLGFGHERISRAWITGEPLPGVTDTAAAGDQSIPAVLERFEVSPGRVADLVDPFAARASDRLLRAMLHGAIDADRIDYLQRDAHYTGVAHGTIDAARLLDTVRTRSGRLLFAEKGQNALEGFLVGRALMYSAVYFHKTVRAAETMAVSAVERLPGYPAISPAIFAATDGELFEYLRRASPRGADIVQRLRERRLFKRAFEWATVSPSIRRSLRRLVREPPRRRALEDRLADSIGAPPGSILLDLAGLSSDPPERGNWSEVGLLEDHRIVHPFRARSVWRSLTLRPPAPWAVAVYADPGWRESAERRLPRILRTLL